MAIHPASRYRSSVVRLIPHKTRGRVEALAFRRPVVMEQPSLERFHEIHDGDELDLISLRYYNTPFLWSLIADRNPEVAWIVDLKEGDTLVIPPRDTPLG